MQAWWKPGSTKWKVRSRKYEGTKDEGGTIDDHDQDRMGGSGLRPSCCIDAARAATCRGSASADESSAPVGRSVEAVDGARYVGPSRAAGSPWARSRGH